MASHPGLDMISFTGSTRAGIEVAQRAAPTVKRVTQELGGKSANVILNNANFEKAIGGGAAHCFMNSGQSCNAHAHARALGADGGGGGHRQGHRGQD